MSITTRKDFKYFVARCEHYIKLWHLDTFNITFEHERLAHYRDAEINMRLVARGATIRLDKDISCVPEKTVLDRLARHEVIHALLMPIGSLASARFVTEDECTQGEHEVVQKLMKLLPIK